ncbi:MAG: hypothetical protein H6623_02800 [Bdellovibrionaceae bacterium]|nr:hypothetical protein [Pseudobdellovibrionaceae bacterium]
MKMIIAILFTLSSKIAWAEEPSITLSIKNGGDLVHMLQSNPWMEDFYKTNLYEGLLLRVSPLLGALPNTDNSTWKGRLADTVIDLALKNRPTHLFYFRRAKLVQPFGFAIQNLSQPEMAALKLIIESLRTTKDQTIEEGKKKWMVTPVEIANQKLAVRLMGSCLAISRDPSVTIWAEEACAKSTPLAKDGRVIVNIATLAGGTAVALKKYIGIEKNAIIELEKKSTSYEIVGGELALSKNHSLKNIKFSEDQLAALPADTHLLVSLATPIPEELNQEEVKIFLTRSPQQWKEALHERVTYFHLGSTRLKEGGVRAETGLLIANRLNKNQQSQWSELFEKSFGNEIYIKDVCKNQITLITQSPAVIEKIESTCQEKIPSLKQMPTDMRALLSQTDGAQSVLINMGQALSHMVDLGWQIDNVDKPEPAEIQEAKKILLRLPAVALGGQVKNNRINYRAQQGVF